MSKQTKNGCAFDEALNRPLLELEITPSESSVSSSLEASTFGVNRSTKNSPSSHFSGFLPSKSLTNDMKSSTPLRYQKNENLFGEDGQRTDTSYSRKKSQELELEIINSLNAADLDSELARERAIEISTINGSMRKIKDIYQDLATIVDKQQDEIDDMEMNAMETNARVKEGIHELEKAASLSKFSKIRSKICYISVAIVAIFIFFTFFFSIQK